MKFDLKLYKTLSPAARRLFLLVLKVSYGKRRLPVFELRHLAVDVLGFASTLAVRDMKVKVRKAQRSPKGIAFNGKSPLNEEIHCSTFSDPVPLPQNMIRH